MEHAVTQLSGPLDSSPTGGPPFFESNGYLAPGIYDCTLDELKPLVCTNAHRQTLWFRLVSFLVWPVLVPRFSNVYIAGGFVSTKPEPEDVDVILETKDPYGPESFCTVERFFLAGLDNIRDIYSIDLHFWMEGAPDSLADYRSFFQYHRPNKDERPSVASRGIIRLSLAELSRKEQLKKHLSPF